MWASLPASQNGKVCSQKIVCLCFLMDHKSKILPKPKYLLLQLHSLEAQSKAKITSSLTVKFSSFKDTLSEPWMSQPQTTFYPRGQLGKLHACTCWRPKHESLGLNSQSYTIILLSSEVQGLHVAQTNKIRSSRKPRHLVF